MLLKRIGKNLRNNFERYQNNIEQLIKPSNEDGEVFQQSPRWMRYTTWGLMATTGLGITWLAIAQTEEIIVAQGKLEPVGGVREIQIPVNGVVQTLDVQEGERVEAGQVLLTLDPETTAQNQKSTTQALKYTKINCTKNRKR